MKERSILFSAQMVRAILDGRKTQTRRPVKPKQDGRITGAAGPGLAAEYLGIDNHGRQCFSMLQCPYGQPGDRLWVRETWQHSNFPLGPYDDGCTVFYRADYFDDPHGPDGEKSPEGKYRTWVPSIHMFRSASRITLEITAVRIERLQDISESDARAEGARECDPVSGQEVLLAGPSQRGSYVLHYQHIWEQINGRGAWDVNPWVWAIEFRRVTP